MINGTMMQFFHWYIANDGTFWKKAKEQAGYLSELGINAVWLPPAHKGKDGPASSGYDMYDLYDLGEFDQKGSVRTKFGTVSELKDAVKSFHDKKIGVYVDIVLNHMGGADETERITVRRVNEENRNEFESGPFEIDAFTKFTFPGRKGKYSQFIWDHKCFTGVDYAHDLGENAIFTIVNEYGEGWEEVVDSEKGNYDYLMFCDIEFRNPAVREELKRFAGWYLNEIKFDGMRLDAVKHIAPPFIIEWLDHIRSLNPDLFAVGEYWAPGDLPLMLKYLDAVGDRMSLFDASLHHNLYQASLQGKDYDLRQIFDNTLVQGRPDKAVTVVDNHDTQPLQALEAPVEQWFKPHAYALILLRRDGYPCVFYPDLYGAHYVDKGKDGNDHEIFLEKCDGIETLLKTRNVFAYGTQRDYFDEPNCIGWTREGVEENRGSGCAVVLSNGDAAVRKMEIGKRHSGKIFVDILRKNPAEVKIGKDGVAEFPVSAGELSVYIQKKFSV
jgi:alpha-amylase